MTNTIFEVAENGARAIELLRTHTDIDLIPLDMVMPEMNGFDVLTAMNNNPPDRGKSLVVMISAENGIEQHRARVRPRRYRLYQPPVRLRWSCAAAAWSTR